MIEANYTEEEKKRMAERSGRRSELAIQGKLTPKVEPGSGGESSDSGSFIFH